VEYFNYWVFVETTIVVKGGIFTINDELIGFDLVKHYLSKINFYVIELYKRI